MQKKSFQSARTRKGEAFFCWIIIGAGIYTIVPFLLLAQFNQPSADDFSLALRDRKNDVTAVLKDVYTNWSGRYMAPVFSRLNPLIDHPSLYKIYPLFLISGFILAAIIVLRELLGSKYSLIEILALSALFIHLVFSQTPSISEAFYWFSGSCIYQTANIFTLLLIAVLSKLRRCTPSASKALYTFLAALLCILIIGCNEVSMVITFSIVFGLTINDFIISKRIHFSNLTLSAVCILCGLAVFLAPGNLNRIDDPAYYNKSPLFTIFGAASVSIMYLLKWGSSLLVVTLVYLSLQSRTIADASEPKRSSFYIKGSILYFMVVFIALQLIIIFIAGGGNLGRIENNVYLLFLTGYFFNLQLVFDKYLTQQVFACSVKKYLVLFSALLFLFDVFNLENNTSSAYIDIISGRARKYNQELEQRAALVKSCKADTCYVPALSVISKSLFVTDIRLPADTMSLWINKSYAEYYHASFVVPAGGPAAVEPNIEIIRRLGKEIRKNMAVK